MAQQASVQPATSDIEQQARERGIRSDQGGYRASNFSGGDVSNQTGNEVPASDAYVRGGYAPTSTGTGRLSQLTPESSLSAPQSPTAPTAPTPLAPAPAAPRAQKADNTGMWVTIGLQVLGAVLCYATDTLVQMADGTWRAIQNIDIGDELMLGGAVVGVGRALSDDVYFYRDQVVTGYHVVFEDGQFLHVRDTESAVRREGRWMVHPVVTENHLMVTQTHIAADFAETDSGSLQTPEERLAELNGNVERCLWLENQNLVPGRGLSETGQLVA